MEHLIKAVKTATGLTKFSHQYKKLTDVFVLFFGKNEGITYPDKENPSILGFEGVKDGSSSHIGYKTIDWFDNLATNDGEAEAFVADYTFDLLAGKSLIFVYSNIIEYQHIGDKKTCVIDSKQRLKNRRFCETDPTHRIVFSNLEYKKLLSNKFQCIDDQLRTETGKLVQFTGRRKVILTLNIKKFR